MNERIRELAEQAGAKFLKNVAVVADNGSSGLATDFIPAFAELIIKECCDVFVELRTRPADLAVKDVQKHFGVE